MTDTFSATAALLARASEGDEDAWNALVSQHTPMLWHVARAHRLDAADASDVVQTTWLRLLEHLGRIEDPTRLIGWLVTTARRESLRTLRRSGRERLAGEDSTFDIADVGAEPLDAQLLTDERNAALWSAFGHLPERCQRLLRVAVAMPQSYGEVAATLDMPIGSIGPTRARCLSRLRVLLEDAALGGPGAAGPAEGGR
jgi:RNA polymerase sigma factor (sigma-70 family)